MPRSGGSSNRVIYKRAHGGRVFVKSRIDLEPIMNFERNPGVSQTRAETLDRLFRMRFHPLTARDPPSKQALVGLRRDEKKGNKTASSKTDWGGGGGEWNDGKSGIAAQSFPRNQVLGNPRAFEHFGAIRESQLCG